MDVDVSIRIGYYPANYVASGGGGPPPPPVPVLMEDGSDVLMEDGTQVLME